MYKALKLAAVLVAAAFASACGAKAKGPPAPPPPQVSVAAPLQEVVTDWDDFSGRFESPQRVDVRARASGYVQSVHFRDGQVVRKGQLLFTLDPRQAQAALASARAQAQQARSELGRAEKLLEKGFLAREAYESKRAAADIANAAVRARELDVEFTRVTAPITGIISDRRVDVGNLVAGGTSAADVLTTIVAVSPIHFSFEASEAQMLKYQRGGGSTGGSRVQVRLQDEADYRWNGRIDFSDSGVDGGSGAVRMRAVIDNPSGFLRPGMFGRARMESPVSYPAFLVPEDAIVADGARKVVYVIGAGNTVQAKPVVTGPLSNGLRVIRSGVAPTDRVIVNGVQRARPGQKVTPKPGAIVRKVDAPSAAPPVDAAPASTATVGR